MAVVDFQESLRARVNQMADEQMALQEMLPTLPIGKVPEHLKKMQEHAELLSRLASRLYPQSADPGPMRHAPCTSQEER